MNIPTPFIPPIHNKRRKGQKCIGRQDANWHFYVFVDMEKKRMDDKKKARVSLFDNKIK
jgi:hypothetical protein